MLIPQDQPSTGRLIDAVHRAERVYYIHINPIKPIISDREVDIICKAQMGEPGTQEVAEARARGGLQGRPSGQPLAATSRRSRHRKSLVRRWASAGRRGKSKPGPRLPGCRAPW